MRMTVNCFCTWLQQMQNEKQAHEIAKCRARLDQARMMVERLTREAQVRAPARMRRTCLKPELIAVDTVDFLVGC